MVQKLAGHAAKEALLSHEQKERCLAIADEQNGRDSQRAAALLALDSGMTQLQAAESSRLTLGQVRYLLSIFRRKEMAIFPNEKELPPSPQAAVSLPVEEGPVELVAKKAVSLPAEKGKGKKKGSLKDKDKKRKGKKGKDKNKKKKKAKAKKKK